MGRIKALDPDVVHKIAAGEIIVSPANALKELIENSLDAGASRVDVVVKDGGHKLLQITDNGIGIEEDDLPILCQRFTTSKISSFNDLKNLQTLGFRGEALASISHVAHLSVKTKTENSNIAIQATFESGKLTGICKSAGVQGTQISVEDLFFNVPLRLKALQSAGSRSSEYQKVLEIVSRYAIQYPGSFSCKRFQDNQPVVIPSASRKEKIKWVFGNNTYQELMDFKLAANPDIGLLGAEGYMTGVNYNTKRSIPYIFFINQRLVSCEPLSRAIRKVYQEFMPRGSTQAFVFLSLNVKSENVDVNIHPTKREVHFLYETEIGDAICEQIKVALTQSGGSRDFRVQSYISASVFPSPRSSKGLDRGAEGPFVTGGVKPRYEYNLVRTDPQQQTLSSYVQQPSLKELRSQSTFEPSSSLPPSQPRLSSLSRESQKEFEQVPLKSVQELLRGVRLSASAQLLGLFSEHTFVGVVDVERGLAAIQVDVRLYLVEYFDVSREFFHQIGLVQFANFGTIHLGDGLPVQQLLAKVSSNTASANLDNMLAMAPMLEEYFQIIFKKKGEDWRLVQLPLMLPDYTPPISKLPRFVADLANGIDWEEEQECLNGVVTALASFHVPTSLTSKADIEKIFNAAKLNFLPSRALASSAVEIANLPGLYRVFERC